ncbi:fungal-specific transcription factor domain protein [Aspergillus steynii IBT 23096]|uniref:Fungal-specific transcription factor domain protein n=1 Tax=Aspergillus steynii IBT 23096 TaxID=1392250 RepID=A0A2I2GGF9_9EURO|nr:fungal-specific transcription factor domain protein [Aspergillus steynii IBT 23096]PLB51963.1 fungal-specific transcription factor domain protein [Aspergillus steynii IBT 23096]
MEPEGPESDGKESLGKRACDQCRARKIRCDKQSPCSNCRSSQISCRSTGAGQKSREPRRRVLISSQYEKKIDLIEERLGSIEQVLRELRSSIGSSSKSPPEPFYHATPVSGRATPSTAEFRSNTTAALDQHEADPAFEGNSSLAAHSAYASKFLESAVSRSALPMYSTPKMGAALSTLKQMVNMQDNQTNSSSREVRFPNQRAMPTSGLRDLIMPPIQSVLPVLRRLKEDPPTALQGFCPFVPPDRLIEKCKEVYFATEEYSDATFIVVNGGLFYVFSEYSYTVKDDETRDNYRKYLKLCHANLETALANLSLLMPARMESVEALTLGAVHAIEISKPSFALTLTSTASRLCQTLGYHRASSMENDSPNVKEHKNRLFWSIYCIDKALSLRLGRASTIQDYDISLSWAASSPNGKDQFGDIYILWIQLARIQGKVYEKLYSPAALCRPESERVSCARQLASDMQWKVMEPFKHLFKTISNMNMVEELYIRSDEVCRLSVLTLIYRAIPPPPDSPSTFIDECIETARTALERHQTCTAMFREVDEYLMRSYLHWTILYSPFVPFIVLFCHIIEVSSYADLERIEEFVASLEPNCALSEAISKMHRLCQVLSTVARLYLEAKSQAQTQQDHSLASVGQEFDSYFTALGLAPAPTDDGEMRWTAGAAVPGPSNAAAAATGPLAGEMATEMRGIESQTLPMNVPQTTLGNWFSGNQHMMGLLEEDWSLFDSRAWPQPEI